MRFAIILAFAVISVNITERALAAGPDVQGKPEPSPYTTEDIAVAMSAARAQYTDMVIRFTDRMQDFELETRKPSGTVVYDTIYKRKAGDNVMESFDFRIKAFDDNGQPRPRPVWYHEMVDNGVVAFDGKTTLVFNRDPDAKGRVKAVNRPGPVHSYAPKHLHAPFAMAMDWYGQSWSEFLRLRASQFNVESQREILGDLPTVLLVGTNTDYAVKIKVWVCPQRSFLPIRMDLEDTANPDHVERRTLHDLMQLSNKMWFPKRIIAENPKSGAREELAVSELSADKLRIDDFHPNLPPKTLVIDMVSGTAFEIPPAPTNGPATRASRKTMETQINSLVETAQDQARHEGEKLEAR